MAYVPAVQRFLNDLQYVPEPDVEINAFVTRVLRAEIAARRLLSANSDTILRVLSRLRYGVEFEPTAASILSKDKKIQATLEQLGLTDSMVFDDAFSATRLALVFPHDIEGDRARTLNRDWVAFRNANLQALRAGSIPHPNLLLSLLIHSEINKINDRFCLELMAASGVEQDFDFHTYNLNRATFGDLLPQVGETRQQIFVNRWLRAQISRTEWLTVKDMAPSIVQGLYPQIWQAGYHGYAEVMNAKRAADG